MFDAELTIADKIRKAILAVPDLTSDNSRIENDTDLYLAGMKSFASVQLLLALEDTFEIEFPDSMLTRATFRSPAAIERSVRALKTFGA